MIPKLLNIIEMVVLVVHMALEMAVVDHMDKVVMLKQIQADLVADLVSRAAAMDTNGFIQVVEAHHILVA